MECAEVVIHNTCDGYSQLANRNLNPCSRVTYLRVKASSHLLPCGGGEMMPAFAYARRTFSKSSSREFGGCQLRTAITVVIVLFLPHLGEAQPSVDARNTDVYDYK